MRILSSVLLVLMFCISTLSASDTADQVEAMAENKDYVEAAKLIPQAVQENKKDVKFIMLCGDIYAELEKWEEALDLYKKAEDIEGDEPYILRKIGKSYSKLGKHKEAFEVLLEAKDEDKDDVYNYLELAYAYLAADSISQAELEITRAVEINSDIPDAYIALGDLYFSQRVYELAKDKYEEALAKDESLIGARIKLATSYYWLANREYDDDLANELFTRSLKEWNRVTQEDPKNAKAFYQQGKILFFSKNFAKAAESFYTYAQLRPEGYLGIWYLGQSLYEVGKCDSAAPYLEIVAENIDSVKTKSRLYLARCYFENKNYPMAIDYYQKLKAETKLEEVDLKRLASSAFNSNDTTLALDTYKEVVDTYPDNNCELMYKLGRMFIGLKKFEESVYVLNRRLATEACQDSLVPTIYYYRGMAHMYGGLRDSSKIGWDSLAKLDFEEALKLDSNNLGAYIYLADVNANLGDNKLAEELFLKAIEIGVADTAKYINNVRQAYQKICGMKLDQKKWSDISKYAKQWTDLEPKSPTAWLYRAVGSQGAGDVESACRYYGKVLSIDPKNRLAAKNRSALNCGG